MKQGLLVGWSDLTSLGMMGAKLIEVTIYSFERILQTSVDQHAAYHVTSVIREMHVF